MNVIFALWGGLGLSFSQSFLYLLILHSLCTGENNGYIATSPRTSEDGTTTDDDDGVHGEKTSAVPNLKKIRKRKLLALKQVDSPNKDIPDPFEGITDRPHTVMPTGI